MNDVLERVLADIRSGERSSAVKALAALISDSALLGDKWLIAARLGQSLGEVDLAKNAVLRYANMKKSDPQRQLVRAGMLAEMGQLSEGLQLIESVQKALPYNPALQHFIGTVRSQLGDIGLATEIFSQLVTVWKSSGQSWLALAALKTFSTDDADLPGLIDAGAAVEKTEPVSRAAYHYALGKAHLDCLNSADAFAAYTTGAAIMKSLNHYHAQDERRLVDTLISSFNKDAFASLGESDSEEHSPIFVLGWPRSGTTLVEQIICAHSQVVGGGEVDFIRKASLELKGAGCKYAQVFEKTFSSPESAWNHLAQLYHHLVEQRFGKKGRIVDKTLNNSRYIGLIGHMFPRAPIVWLRRQPLDAAWSCKRTCFSANMPWSWSLTDIAAHFNNEDRLFTHWRNLLGDKILVVPYEELVASPQVWIQKILAHCQLSNESQVSTFYNNDRAVTTSSSLQVRHPVNQRSVGVPAEIADYMQRFVDVYEYNH